MTQERRPDSAGDIPDLEFSSPTDAAVVQPPGPGRDSGLSRFVPDDLADRAAAESRRSDHVAASLPDAGEQPAGDPQPDSPKVPPTIWEQKIGRASCRERV